MTLRQYLALMSLGTILCFSVWLYVLFAVDPERAGWVGFVFFFVTLFFSLIGMFSIFGFKLTRKKGDEELEFKKVSISFWRAVFFAALIVLLLIFLPWIGGRFFLIILGIISLLLIGAMVSKNKINN